MVQGYNPQVVVTKSLVPWFDERIQDSQLGWQLHTENMHAAGMGFIVHPEAFLVKQPLLDKLSDSYNSAAQKADVSRATMHHPSLCLSVCLSPSSSVVHAAWGPVTCPTTEIFKLMYLFWTSVICLASQLLYGWLAGGAHIHLL